MRFPPHTHPEQTPAASFAAFSKEPLRVFTPARRQNSIISEFRRAASHIGRTAGSQRVLKQPPTFIRKVLRVFAPARRQNSIISEFSPSRESHRTNGGTPARAEDAADIIRKVLRVFAVGLPDYQPNFLR